MPRRPPAPHDRHHRRERAPDGLNSTARRAGRLGLDALWNDDFHHAMHGGPHRAHEAYYSDYRGSPRRSSPRPSMASSIRASGTLAEQAARHARPATSSPPRFVSYLENHDQVANPAWGSRCELTSPGRYRAATALLLLAPVDADALPGPGIRGSTPFLYFADHKPEMAKVIAKGRKEFLSQFPSLSDGIMTQFLAEPGREETFEQSRLNFRERCENFRFYALFKDLAGCAETTRCSVCAATDKSRGRCYRIEPWCCDSSVTAGTGF